MAIHDDDDIRLIFFRRLLRKQKIRIKGRKIFVAGLIGGLYLIVDLVILGILVLTIFKFGAVLWLLFK